MNQKIQNSLIQSQLKTYLPLLKEMNLHFKYRKTFKSNQSIRKLYKDLSHKCYNNMRDGFISSLKNLPCIFQKQALRYAPVLKTATAMVSATIVLHINGDEYKLISSQQFISENPTFNHIASKYCCIENYNYNSNTSVLQKLT